MDLCVQKRSHSHFSLFDNHRPSSSSSAAATGTLPVSETGTEAWRYTETRENVARSLCQPLPNPASSLPVFCTVTRTACWQKKTSGKYLGSRRFLDAGDGDWEVKSDNTKVILALSLYCVGSGVEGTSGCENASIQAFTLGQAWMFSPIWCNEILDRLGTEFTLNRHWLRLARTITC